MTDTTIEFVRQNEGRIYGDGSAALIQAIKDKLLAIPGPRPLDPRATRDVIHEVLVEHSRAAGQNPDIEVFKREDHLGADFYVGWESGPYQWAIQASFVVMDASGRLAEPYYSFDLCLYNAE